MRARRFQSSLLMLAFASVLLMALAPVVSRIVQLRDGQQAIMATHDGHAMHDTLPAPDEAAHHAGMAHHGMGHASMDHASMNHAGMDHAAASADAHAQQPVSIDTGDKPTPPADPHAGHGEACEYCTMASRLLPWLAVALVLAPLLYRPVPLSPRVVTLPASLRWPAHPVRGPPLFS